MILRRYTKNIHNRSQEKIENQGNIKQISSIENRGNSPSIKIGKIKQVLEKIVSGKFRRWGKIKRNTNQTKKKKKKKVEDIHEYEYSLFQYMQT